MNTIATRPITYVSGTMPFDALNTMPKIANGAIGTMNTRPYTSRSTRLRLRRSCVVVAEVGERAGVGACVGRSSVLMNDRARR